MFPDLKRVPFCSHYCWILRKMSSLKENWSGVVFWCLCSLKIGFLWLCVRNLRFWGLFGGAHFPRKFWGFVFVVVWLGLWHLLGIWIGCIDLGGSFFLHCILVVKAGSTGFSVWCEWSGSWKSKDWSDFCWNPWCCYIVFSANNSYCFWNIVKSWAFS